MQRLQLRRPLCAAAVLLIVGCAPRAGSEPQPAQAPRSTEVAPTAPAAAPVAPAPAPEPAAAAPAPTVDDEALGRELARYFAQAGPSGREAWYGVYMMGKKVGSAHSRQSLSAPGDPGRYFVGMSMDMRVVGLGHETAVRIEDARWYGGEAPWPLVEARFSQTTPQGSEVRRGVAAAGGLEVSKVGSADAPRTLPATAETLVGASMGAFFAADTLKAGLKGSGSVFNWQDERDEHVDIEVLAVSQEMRAGVVIEVAEVAVTLRGSGMRMTHRVAADGVVLEMSLGLGLKLRLEEPEVARSGVQGMEVLGTALAVERDLGDPRGIRELVLGFSSSAGPPPASAGQVVEPAGEGRYKILLKTGAHDPVAAEERAAALESDADHDAAHPAIAAKAKALTEGVADEVERVAAIRRFVFGALEKRLATWVPSASAILAGGVGDCTEHSTLFVALCRAAGIPARPVFGVAYLGAGSRAFGYHAWAEVALGGRWVAVDPTWDEAAADATHLVMGRGVLELGRAMLAMPTLEVLGEPVR
jgi:hypothetical protein